MRRENIPTLWRRWTVCCAVLESDGPDYETVAVFLSLHARLRSAGARFNEATDQLVRDLRRAAWMQQASSFFDDGYDVADNEREEADEHDDCNDSPDFGLATIAQRAPGRALPKGGLVAALLRHGVCRVGADLLVRQTRFNKRPLTDPTPERDRGPQEVGVLNAA